MKRDWIVIDFKIQPPVLKCLRCGDSVPQPLGLFDYVLGAMKGFSKAHSMCSKKEKLA